MYVSLCARRETIGYNQDTYCNTTHACGGWVRCEYKRILAHQGGMASRYKVRTRYKQETSEIQSNTGGASCMYPAYIRPANHKRFVTTRGWWVTCLLGACAARMAGRDLIHVRLLLLDRHHLLLGPFLGRLLFSRVLGILVRRASAAFLVVRATIEEHQCRYFVGMQYDDRN